MLIPNDKSITEQKEIAEEILSEAFARDLITMEEFEKRLSAVDAAGSNRDLQNELKDLPENILQYQKQEEYPQNKSPKKSVLVLSSKSIRGAKLKKKNSNSVLVLAEQKMDYTKTLLEPGVYYINTNAILSTLHIIVPENYAVTVEMETILSEIKEDDTRMPGPGVPEIIVRGKVVLGEVKIKKKGSGFIEKIISLLGDGS